MSDYAELKRLAESLIKINEANIMGWAETVKDARIGKTSTEFALAASPSKILSLINEYENLRKDAERYRWFREQGWSAPAEIWATRHGIPVVHTDLDEAIDTSMSKEP